jgi:hypothetical protein
VAKTIKVEGVFEVLNTTSSTVEGKQIIRDSADYSCVTTLHPTKLPGGVANQIVSFGGVLLAKRLFLSVDFEVIVKFNAMTEDGFNFGPGEMTVMNDSGITALYITPGPNETEVTAVIAGD